MCWSAAGQQTSRPKLPAFFEKLSKRVGILRVNETKVTSRNAFVDNIYELESENE